MVQEKGVGGESLETSCLTRVDVLGGEITTRWKKAVYLLKLQENGYRGKVMKERTKIIKIDREVMVYEMRT